MEGKKQRAQVNKQCVQVIEQGSCLPPLKAAAIVCSCCLRKIGGGLGVAGNTAQEAVCASAGFTSCAADGVRVVLANGGDIPSDVCGDRIGKCLKCVSPTARVGSQVGAALGIVFGRSANALDRVQPIWD